ncbi:hypothetical protein [Zunongwangia sp. H14]|uniref:hypothetical protein n=1 Tax=Zunongwangia sp. H14 TaxID=3240792 RepID=UPI003561AA15
MKSKIVSILPLIFISIGCENNFSRYDHDNDSMWNGDEFKNAYTENFSNWDEDNDDLLDGREFFGSTFRYTDLNDDGKIDEDEWNQDNRNLYRNYAGEEDFNKFDANADGSIDEEEWTDGFLNSDWFDSYDIDRDGYMNPDELNEGIFEDWDSNGDGFLNEDEYEAGDAYFNAEE